MAFTPHNKSRLIHVSAWTVCVLYFAISYFLLWWDYAPKPVSFHEPLISALSITACCYLIYSTLQFYLPRKRQYFKMLAICFVLTLISMFLSIFALQQIFNSFPLSHFYQTLPYHFIINFLFLFCVMIINIFWNMQQEYEENKKRKEESERILRDAELYNLRQQLQPHFLFNSLNSIIALIGIKPEEARNMTFQLSDFLRGTMRKDDKQLQPLIEEISHLQLYLAIEKVRFGHRLSTGIHVQNGLEQAKVPPMIIQPLLENAIKFGLYNIIGEVNINIDIQLSQHMLYITITNPFDSSQFENHKGTGFGLSSIQRRLFLLYGRTDLLETKVQDSLFIATLKIPQYD